MTISENAWVRFTRALAAVDNTAARKFAAYLTANPIESTEDQQAAVEYANALVSSYGEGAAALACEMYDATAAASGMTLPPAEPAELPGYGEVAKAINGVLKHSDMPEQLSAPVARLVKRTGADTTLKNAIRDGAEFAWVPHGDTCAFCLMLASNGWQRASKKALKNGHAAHIHAHCDCTYAVRFDGKTTVAGYDPDKYREMYDNAEGDTWQEKLNSMRRDQYADNKDKINARKRELYAVKKDSLPNAAADDKINKDYRSILAAKQPGDTVQPASIRGDYNDFRELELTDEERADLTELRRLAVDTNSEHGMAVYQGGKTKIQTDNDHNMVEIGFPKGSEHVTLYHSHTDDSVLSPEDFKSVLNQDVDRDAVISANGDIWIVDFTTGIRPAKEYFDKAIAFLRDDVDRDLKNDPSYEEWSFDERYYMRGREIMLRTSRLFEWNLMGGHLDG